MSCLTNFWCRYLLQDIRNIPSRVLCSLPRSLHVFRQHLQHVHEDILHCLDSFHYLPDAHPQTLLHNIWFAWWLVPSFENIVTGSCSAGISCSCGRHILGVDVVILPLAGGVSFCALNRNVEQNQNNRKHDKPLCCMSWTLSLLLHP